jgi:hypothetical protein
MASIVNMNQRVLLVHDLEGVWTRGKDATARMAEAYDESLGRKAKNRHVAALRERALGLCGTDGPMEDVDRDALAAHFGIWESRNGSMRSIGAYNRCVTDGRRETGVLDREQTACLNNLALTGMTLGLAERAVSRMPYNPHVKDTLEAVRVYPNVTQILVSGANGIAVGYHARERRMFGCRGCWPVLRDGEREFSYLPNLDDVISPDAVMTGRFDSFEHHDGVTEVAKNLGIEPQHIVLVDTDPCELAATGRALSAHYGVEVDMIGYVNPKDRDARAAYRRHAGTFSLEDIPVIRDFRQLEGYVK